MAEPETVEEEAAEAVVNTRRNLTAATQRLDAAVSALRERQTPVDRTRAEQAEHDYRLAQETHRLAVDRLREALQTPCVHHGVDDLRQVIQGFNLKSRQDRARR